MREPRQAEGRPPRYDGRWRDRDPAEAPAGMKPAIRLKAPREGETVVEDLVQGTVRVAEYRAGRHDHSALATARRPICMRWWWTTMTWQSPM